MLKTGGKLMKIRDIMTPDVVLVNPNTAVRNVAIRMRDEDVGALPVGENDRLAGMVTDRDVVVRGVAENQSPSDCTVKDVMSEGVYYCFDDEEAERAADLMTEHKVRRLPVVNRDKRLVGIVALADLAQAGISEFAIGEVSEPTPQARL